MIDLKPLKNESTNFPEPLRSIIEMSRSPTSEGDFIDFFIGLRRKARQMDTVKKEAVKND
jgi:hypothetical protein